MLAIPFFCNAFALLMLQEATGAFDDLGNLLLGGVSIAVVVAIGFTVVRFHVRDKTPRPPSVLSISSPDEE